VTSHGAARRAWREIARDRDDFAAVNTSMSRSRTTPVGPIVVRLVAERNWLDHRSLYGNDKAETDVQQSLARKVVRFAR